MEPIQSSRLSEVQELKDKMQFYRGVVWCLQQMLQGRHVEDVCKEVDPKIRAVEEQAQALKRSLNEKGIV